MDNLISGIIGGVLFIAFTAGLADSIGHIPFYIIVALVVTMLLVDLYQSGKAGLAEEKEAKQARR